MTNIRSFQAQVCRPNLNIFLFSSNKPVADDSATDPETKREIRPLRDESEPVWRHVMLPNFHRNPEQVKLYQIKRHPASYRFPSRKNWPFGLGRNPYSASPDYFKSVMNRLYRDNLGLCIQKSFKNPCDVNQKLPSSIRRFPIKDDKKQPPDHYHHHYCIKKIYPTRFGSEDKHLTMWQYPLRRSVEILGSCKQSPKVWRFHKNYPLLFVNPGDSHGLILICILH